MAWVIGVLGGASAFVGVLVIKLSEEHGSSFPEVRKGARSFPPRLP
jgi:hypothetical protein